MPNLSFDVFRYVAPEYANTGMLNEKSDVYSFGVVLLETVTGRDPIDYSRPANEVYTLICFWSLFISFFFQLSPFASWYNTRLKLICVL